MIPIAGKKRICQCGFPMVHVRQDANVANVVGMSLEVLEFLSEDMRHSPLINMDSQTKYSAVAAQSVHSSHDSISFLCASSETPLHTSHPCLTRHKDPNTDSQ
ncbi:unnamed protein product [Lepeophtheirus salmonis]|uniref:(salmon louse) hypothetical protein n=1 Tax=Lepeophtheirus salmonis TaxID=72036 RepID=A0A7R8H6V2_LEPSM|nr:unnamed protein product [Lepeophtheirus salmonis]CAF2904235.1 unnamed protein product [Lepeophtheirus salmonis]